MGRGQCPPQRVPRPQTPGSTRGSPRSQQPRSMLPATQGQTWGLSGLGEATVPMAIPTLFTKATLPWEG